MKWKGERDETGLKVVWGLEDFCVLAVDVLVAIIFTFVVMGPLFLGIATVVGNR